MPTTPSSAGVKLGHEGIAYRQVRAADANQRRRLIDAPVGAALRLRVVQRADGLVELTKTRLRRHRFRPGAHRRRSGR